MHFVRYLKGGNIRRGVLQDGYVQDLLDLMMQGGRSAEWSDGWFETPLEQWLMKPGFMDAVRGALAHAGNALPPSQSVNLLELLPPVDRPGKVIAVGLNYPPADSGEAYSPPPYPVLFHKAATSLVGHGGKIVLPKISNEVEYEGELALVIGREARKVSPADAMDFVAGITIANDVGARDIQQRSSQWTSGKMFDTFCPLGPALVTLDEIGDLSELRIMTFLNDEIVQDASCSAMIFDVRFLVSYISELTTLSPGDLILTGSPKTVGERPAANRLLEHGDIVQITIESLGMLVNSVEKEK